MQTKSRLFSLIITLVIVMIGVISDVYNKKKEIITNQNINRYSYVVISKEDIIENHINNNLITYQFYADMFGINLDDLKQELIFVNQDNIFNELSLNNKDIYNSFDEALLNFILDLENEKKELFTRKYVYKTYNKEYIYGLIDYFASIFNNVDIDIAKAICFQESGNLTAKNMLKKNNIFGGMKNGKLIKYSSIEYGVYKYISLLSKSYYNKGLNTVEKIGKKYNPEVINGVTVANQEWVRNVKKFRNRFDKEATVTSVDELLELRVL